MEDVVRVPSGLDLRQSCVVSAEGSCDVAPVILIHVVHVACFRKEWFQPGKAVACPRDILFRGRSILPLRKDQQIVAFATMVKGGVVLRDASDGAVPVLQEDA